MLFMPAELLWMYVHGFEGVNLGSFIGNAVYMLVCGSLAYSLIRGSQRTDRNDSTRRLFRAYMIWGVINFLDILIIFLMGYRWDKADLITTIISSAGFIFGIGISVWKRIPWNHPVLKACWASTLKILPNVLSAWKILLVGGAGGIPIIVYLAAHLLVVVRILFICVGAEKVGWRLESKVNFFIETLNLGTIFLITLTWWYVQ